MSNEDLVVVGIVVFTFLYIAGSLLNWIFGELEYRRFVNGNNGTDEGIDE